ATLTANASIAHTIESPFIVSQSAFSQVKQSPAVRNGDGFGSAQDVQFSEHGLDVTLHGDFRDRQVSADQLVGFAGSDPSQALQFARSQFFRGQSFRKFRRNSGWKERSAGVH